MSVCQGCGSQAQFTCRPGEGGPGETKAPAGRIRDTIGAFSITEAPWGLGGATMYLMIISDAPALPVDLCIASAMLGHAAWALRPEELGALAGSRPTLVLLDLARPTDVIRAVSAVRDRYRDVAVAIVGAPPIPGEEGIFALDKPVTADSLRDVMRRATAVAA